MNEKEKEDLELEFMEACNKANHLINKKIEIATKALDEAVSIAEEYGVPFYARISPVGNTYTPIKFKQKYDSIDRDLLSANEIDYSGYSGWEHSAVC